MKIGGAGVWLQRDAVERTDIHAVFASSAIIGDHLRFWDLLGLHSVNQCACRILDAGNRAVNGANTALDTAFRMDLEGDLFTSIDGVGGAFLLANSAANAGVSNEVGHVSRQAALGWVPMGGKVGL